MKPLQSIYNERRRFAGFLLAGGLAAVVNVVARVIASEFMRFEIAVIVAYVIAMVTAFALNRAFVFEATGRSITEELTKFAIVNFVAIIQVWGVTMLLHYYILPAIGWTWHPELVSHLIGVASPVFTSYLGHKYFSFRAIPPVVENQEDR